MNNEEKILQLLEGISKKLDSMDGRMDRMEGRLDSVETLAQRTTVLLETDYADKLQLLFDGHELIKEKLDGLAPRSRVDDLEADVAMLKDVIKLMRMEITELKKEQ